MDYQYEIIEELQQLMDQIVDESSIMNQRLELAGLDQWNKQELNQWEKTKEQKKKLMKKNQKKLNEEQKEQKKKIQMTYGEKKRGKGGKEGKK